MNGKPSCTEKLFEILVAVNLSQFPSPFYMAGQKFESETIFRFFTEA